MSQFLNFSWPLFGSERFSLNPSGFAPEAFLRPTDSPTPLDEVADHWNWYRQSDRQKKPREHGGILLIETGGWSGGKWWTKFRVSGVLPLVSLLLMSFAHCNHLFPPIGWLYFPFVSFDYRFVYMNSQWSDRRTPHTKFQVLFTFLLLNNIQILYHLSNN